MFSKNLKLIISKWIFYAIPMTIKPASLGLNSFSIILKATSATSYQVYTIRSRTVQDVDVFVITLSHIFLMG